MAFSKSRPIHVIVPPKLDLDAVHDVTAKTLGIVGCPRCHSGFDLRFHQEEIIVFDKGLEAKTFNAGK
jgi:hypothetical protein